MCCIEHNTGKTNNYNFFETTCENWELRGTEGWTRKRICDDERGDIS